MPRITTQPAMENVIFDEAQELTPPVPPRPRRNEAEAIRMRQRELILAQFGDRVFRTEIPQAIQEDTNND